MNSSFCSRSVFSWHGVARAGVAALVVAATLAACGGAPPSPSPSSPAADAGAPATSPGPADAGGTSTPAAAPEVNPAGDIPDNQVYVPYTAPDGSFTVRVPEGWARSSQGGATVFSDNLNSVRIETGPRPTPPDVASARAQAVPALQASVPGFSLRDVTTVQRSAGQVVLMSYAATSPPDPVTGRATADAVERYVFWKDGEQVILTLSGPQGADNVDPWRTVTDSLAWQR